MCGIFSLEVCEIFSFTKGAKKEGAHKSSAFMKRKIEMENRAFYVKRRNEDGWEGGLQVIEQGFQIGLV